MQRRRVLRAVLRPHRRVPCATQLARCPPPLTYHRQRRHLGCHAAPAGAKREPQLAPGARGEQAQRVAQKWHARHAPWTRAATRSQGPRTAAWKMRPYTRPLHVRAHAWALALERGGPPHVARLRASHFLSLRSACRSMHALRWRAHSPVRRARGIGLPQRAAVVRAAQRRALRAGARNLPCASSARACVRCLPRQRAWTALFVAGCGRSAALRSRCSANSVRLLPCRR